ncbi:AAA family ATPase [Actinomadura meridiana]|uniref:AAA family ATPase n=1 Tax=Actinomadura meridiana TaxID=559626 RepID=A0ABP8BWF5_9ACTN
MITRIEIDGFKSFLDFQLDVPPFLALVGPNASGKSNLLDAIKLVANIMMFGPERGLIAQDRGGAADLFHRFADGDSVNTVTITVDMIIGGVQGFGPVPIRSRVVLRKNAGVPEVSESVAWVSTPEELSWLERRGVSVNSAGELREGRRTLERYGEPAFIQMVPGDGLPRMGQFWRHLLLEVRWWHPFSLEPKHMRRPAEGPDMLPLETDGRNLAAVLHRLGEWDELWRVEADLAAVIPGATEIKPLFDERRQEYDFDVVFASSGLVQPRLLSDGTLRAMGLLAARHDPLQMGTLAIEEVENGLHPSRVAELVRRLTRDLPDFRADESLRSPHQVLLTTHSPALVSALWPEQAEGLVFTESVTHVEGARQRRSKVTRALPVAENGEPGTFTSPWDVEEFLSVVEWSEP